MRHMLTVLIVALFFSGCSSKKTVVKKILPTWIKDQNGCKAWNPHPVQNETVTWTGRCKDGKVDGFGTFIWYKNGKVNQKHIGEYKKGKTNGQGTLTWTSVNKHEEWRGKVKHKYTGQWKNGKKNGHGELIIKTPVRGGIRTDKYVGEFKDNKKHGKGIRVYDSGGYNVTKGKRIVKITKAIGEWKYGKRHGFMKRIYHDGTYRIEEWKNGKRVRGKQFYANGKPYKKSSSQISFSTGNINDMLTAAIGVYAGLAIYGLGKAINTKTTYSDEELAFMEKERVRISSNCKEMRKVCNSNCQYMSFSAPGLFNNPRQSCKQKCTVAYYSCTYGDKKDMQKNICKSQCYSLDIGRVNDLTSSDREKCFHRCGP